MIIKFNPKIFSPLLLKVYDKVCFFLKKNDKYLKLCLSILHMSFC